MSKFDRHKKKAERYVYPHKHCQRCEQMIEESMSFCPECYRLTKEKKKKKNLRKTEGNENEDKEEKPQ